MPSGREIAPWKMPYKLPWRWVQMGGKKYHAITMYPSAKGSAKGWHHAISQCGRHAPKVKVIRGAHIGIYKKILKSMPLDHACGRCALFTGNICRIYARIAAKEKRRGSKV